MVPERAPRLSAVAVHWRDEENLGLLIAAWPDDPRAELIVVDNSRSAPATDRPSPGAAVRILRPPANLGFGAGFDFGAREARGDLLLALNPDARPTPGAVDELLRAFDADQRAAGVVPRLEGPDGSSQHRWQLRPLPTPLRLVLQTLWLAGVHGPRRPPPAGTRVEQPAAAALALRRTALETVGGFDGGYFPAWFEDVDLARRLAARGLALRYAPAARFVHAGGASIPALGYGPFLWIYYRHLARYLGRHHGRGWAATARTSLLLGLAARLLALPFRRPRRARGRVEAARGLAAAALGALTGWRYPHRYRRAYAGPDELRDG